MVSWNQDDHFGRKWIPCFVTALFFAGSFTCGTLAEDTPVRESMLAIPRLEKVPYYAGDPRVQTTSKDLLVSFYTKRDRTMVVVSNLTANKIKATLKLDREGLGLPSGTLPAQDVLGGQTTVQGPITADTLFAGRRFDDIQDSSDTHRYPPRGIPPNQSPVLEGDEFPVEVGPRDLLVLRVN